MGVEWIVIIAGVYFLANVWYAAVLWKVEHGLTAKQTVWCVLAGIPLLFSAFFIIWFFPMAFPDTFSVGGDFRREP